MTKYNYEMSKSNGKKHYFEISEYIKTLSPVNTHCHHKPDIFFKNDFCLKNIIDESYINWCGVGVGDTYENRKRFFPLIKNRSYFKWFERSLQTIYKIDDPLNEDTYDRFDASVRETYKENPEFHTKLLKEDCGYERIILDINTNPGYDNGHPELYSSTFRIDSFMVGFDPLLKGHDKVNCSELFGNRFGDFNTFFQSMRDVIIESQKKGAVSLKCAIPYDRGLDFDFVGETQARKVFETKDRKYNAKDVKAFQDYVFLKVCEIATELDMPLQIHTGLGRLSKTNAYLLQPVIEAYPKTRFVLFHGSYPWLDDILGLVHVYPNSVFPDICWLPLISTDAAIRMLSELIEVANANSICWGCDTKTGEESYGALMAVRHVIASVLSDKIESGYLGLRDALEIASNIMSGNAKLLYKIQDSV